MHRRNAAKYSKRATAFEIACDFTIPHSANQRKMLRIFQIIPQPFGIGDGWGEWSSKI
jgi:hypothetical protein